MGYCGKLSWERGSAMLEKKKGANKKGSVLKNEGEQWNREILYGGKGRVETKSMTISTPMFASVFQDKSFFLPPLFMLTKPLSLAPVNLPQKPTSFIQLHET